MSSINWGALLVFAQKVADDIKQSRPPPAPDQSDSAESVVEDVIAAVPKWQAAWTKYAGAETAIADILAALAADGVPYAATVRNALLSTPEALAEIKKWGPYIFWFIGPASSSADAQNFTHHIGRG